MTKKIIQRGAEAVLYVEKTDHGTVLVKDRIAKNYRIPELDRRIRSQRTRREARLIERAGRAGVETPVVRETRASQIVMDFIQGERLRESYNTMGKKERLVIAEKIGHLIAALHQADIMHGDLTTSNMIVSGQRLYLIDFGLGKLSRRAEDKAVDLYLLCQALKSTHFRFWEEIWEMVLNTYKQNYLKSNEALTRLKKIEKRRRYS